MRLHSRTFPTLESRDEEKEGNKHFLKFHPPPHTALRVKRKNRIPLRGSFSFFP